MAHLPDEYEHVPVSWDDLPGLFSLDPSVSHLNNGSFGAVPLRIQQVQASLRREMEANPMAFFARGLTDRIADARRRLAAFVKADPQATALVPNATTAAQIVLNSLDIGPGDEILLTNHGYGAVRLAVGRLCRVTGATATEVELPLHLHGQVDATRRCDDEIVDILTRAAQPGRTRLLIVDHVTSPTAKLLPVDQIVTRMRDLDIPVMVDAAHAPGMLEIDVGTTGADFWLGNFHKWAFAPRPTALLVVAEHRRHRMRELVVSWQHDIGFPDAEEFSGTLDYTGWLAAPAAVAFLEALGPQRVRQHNAELAAYGQRVVAAALRIDAAELPVAPEAPVSMRLIPLPRSVADDRPTAVALRDRIAQESRCEVALDAWNGRGYLRLSAQIYNRPDQYDRLAEALPGFLR